MSEKVSSITDDLTQRVIRAYSQIKDPRARQLVISLIKHLHNYVKETQLTSAEYEFAWNFLTRMGLFTNDTAHQYTPFERNEFLLLGDIFGISELVELINYPQDESAIGPSLLGPFYLAGVPFRKRGDSVVTDVIAGTRVIIKGIVRDGVNLTPIENAVLDFWQCDTRGRYETEDPSIPKGNLRGKFKTDNQGSFEFTALYPTAYPIIIDGPDGDLLVRAAHLKYYRPAHLHFIVSASGYKPFTTQIFADTEVKLEDDPTFSATQDTLGHFKKEGDIYHLELNFHLTVGSAKYPVSPLNGDG